MLQRLVIIAAGVAVSAFGQQLTETASSQTIIRNDGQQGIIVLALRCAKAENPRGEDIFYGSMDVSSAVVEVGRTATVDAAGCKLDFVLWSDGSYEGPDETHARDRILHRLERRAEAAQDYLAARERGTVETLLAEKGGHHGTDQDYATYIRELCRMHLGRAGAKAVPDQAEAQARQYIQRRPAMYPKTVLPGTAAAYPPCTWCILTAPVCLQKYTKTNSAAFVGTKPTTRDTVTCEADRALDEPGSMDAVVSRRDDTCYDSTLYYSPNGYFPESASAGIAAIGCPSLIEGWTDSGSGSVSKGLVAYVMAAVEITSDITHAVLKDGSRVTPCAQATSEALWTLPCPNYIGHYAMW